MTTSTALTADRHNAFAQIGTDVSGCSTALDALKAAGMTGWNVHKVPLTFGAGQEVPDRFAVVRDLPNTDRLGYLGQVGKVYKPFQNEATAEVLDYVRDQGGLGLGHAGMLDGGAKTFLTMPMPKSLVIEGMGGAQDRTDWNLVAFNSHDGSTALRFAVTGIRVWCANQNGAVIAGAPSFFTIRHTKHARFAMNEIRTGLKIAYRYADAFEQEAAALYAAQMAVDEAERFVKELFEVEKASTREKAANLQVKANEVMRLFEKSESIAPIAGTRWAAYNAATEWADHKQVIKGRFGIADKRAARTLTNKATSDFKARAFALLAAA
ncbi:DUF932 domain-containing protein [Mycobacteroides abscessus]|nr:DUF932 domain-containing protein [Mycobacteroides abscessus]